MPVPPIAMEVVYASSPDEPALPDNVLTDDDGNTLVDEAGTLLTGDVATF